MSLTVYTVKLRGIGGPIIEVNGEGNGLIDAVSNCGVEAFLVVFDKGFVIKTSLLCDKLKVNVVLVDSGFALSDLSYIELCSDLRVSISEGVNDSLVEGGPSLS